MHWWPPHSSWNLAEWETVVRESRRSRVQARSATKAEYTLGRTGREVEDWISRRKWVYENPSEKVRSELQTNRPAVRRHWKTAPGKRWSRCASRDCFVAQESPRREANMDSNWHRSQTKLALDWRHERHSDWMQSSPSCSERKLVLPVSKDRWLRLLCWWKKVLKRLHVSIIDSGDLLSQKVGQTNWFVTQNFLRLSFWTKEWSGLLCRPSTWGIEMIRNQINEITKIYWLKKQSFHLKTTFRWYTQSNVMRQSPLTVRGQVDLFKRRITLDAFFGDQKPWGAKVQILNFKWAKFVEKQFDHLRHFRQGFVKSEKNEFVARTQTQKQQFESG